MSKNKLAMVIAASDGWEHTVNAIKSAMAYTETPYQLIVVDNASTDGTTECLKKFPEVKVLRSDTLLTYSKAINLGLNAASKDCNYLAVLNNDLVFTQGWDTKLIYAIEHPELILGMDKIGIAGPMSNHVAGLQQIKEPRYNINTLHEFSVLLDKIRRQECRIKGESLAQRAGFLSGFCWIMTRECFEAVGELDDLNKYRMNNTDMPLGFEDNDYIVRADLAGHASVIARNAFVHHVGGQTTLRLKQDFARRGLKNRFPYHKKWEMINSQKSNKKLVAGYRVKNVERWFDRVLTKMEEVADEIVVFDDNSTDKTVEIAQKHKKVVEIHRQTETTFNEARDREILYQLCKSRNPDWVIINDGDEELEEKFTREVAEKLMNPIRPDTHAYIFRYITHWDSEDMQRTDGIFGNMANVRMVRNMPNQHIVSNHPQGFHCNSVPWVPIENVVITPYRIRHYGYVDRDDRVRKYNWYQDMDTDKRTRMIGASDYSHLIDVNVKLVKYTPDNTLGLIMIARNEEENLEVFLDSYHMFFDEMVIVDTGSKDNTKWIAEHYGAKVYDYVWKDNFADARDFARSKSTAKWCFQLDPDERLSNGNMGLDVFRFYRMIEEPVLAYVIPVINYVPSGKNFISENSRMFRNLPEVKYSGEVHESVNDSLSNIKMYGKTIFVANPQEGIHHFGYLKDPMAVEKKLKRYARICEKILAGNPNDGMAHFSLALHRLNEGREDDSEYHFKQAMIHSPKLTQSHNQLASLYIRKARTCLEHAIANTNPAHPVYSASKRMLDHIMPYAEDVEIVGMPGRKDIVPD